MAELKKIAGIDFGDARIGVAISDTNRIIAFPNDVLKVTGIDDAVKKTAEKLDNLGVSEAVIGMPKNMDGSSGFRADRTKRFGDMLSELSGCKLYYYDERLSTVMAHGYLAESGISSKKHKKVVDALSAQIILQDYLDSKNTSQL